MKRPIPSENGSSLSLDTTQPLPANGRHRSNGRMSSKQSHAAPLDSSLGQRPPSGHLREELRRLLGTVKAVRQGDFSARFPLSDSLVGEIGEVLNDIIELNESLATELVRVGKIVGQEG